MTIEEFMEQHNGFPTYEETWKAAQAAERERIKKIIAGVGWQGNHDKWFDAVDAILDRIEE